MNVGTFHLGRRKFGVLLVFGALALIPGAAFGQDVTTLEAGKLTVGVTVGAPVVVSEGGAYSGVDVDIINAVGAALGLEVVYKEYAFADLLAAVAAGEVDAAAADIFWTAERAAEYSLTESIYYNPPLVLTKAENNWTTVADLAGQTVGTGTGFSTIPELEAIPGIGGVMTYDTAEAAIADLLAGTITALVLDPPVLSQALVDNLDAGLHVVTLAADPAYPVLTAINAAVIAVGKDNAALSEAISAEILTLWDGGQITTILTDNGLTSESYLVAPDPSPRVGVDREEGYVAPSAAMDGTPAA